MTAFYSSSSGFCTNHCSVVREGCFDLQDSFSGPLPKFNSEPGRFSACGFTAAIAPVWVQRDLFRRYRYEKTSGRRACSRSSNFRLPSPVVSSRREAIGDGTRERSVAPCSLRFVAAKRRLITLSDFPHAFFLTSRQSARKI